MSVVAKGNWDDIVLEDLGCGWQSVDIRTVYDAGNGWKYLPLAGRFAYAFKWVESAASRDGMVWIRGGTLPAGSDQGQAKVKDFFISPYEVTWREWEDARAWAIANGYELMGVGEGCADDHPVQSVNFHEVVRWCNARSEMEGLMPVYRVDGEVYKTARHADNLQWLQYANGYRLPTAVEWKFAAGGGTQNSGYRYSGSDDLGTVGWSRATSGGAACDLMEGRGTWPVGQKAANELGLYDMSGNVWEWCWDVSDAKRQTRGGSYAYDVTISNYLIRDEKARSPSVGFRLVRNPDFSVSAWEDLVVADPWPGWQTVGIHYVNDVDDVWKYLPEHGVWLYIAEVSDHVHIPAGTFTMGSQNYTPAQWRAEIKHQVTLTRPFSVQRTEVYWRLWNKVRDWAVMHGYSNMPNGQKGSHGAGWNTDRDPVTMVSWIDAVKWCNARSEMEGLQPVYTYDGNVYRLAEYGSRLDCDFKANGYRLPTEAEWEYAARAGTITDFYSGEMTYTTADDLDPNLDKIGWYGANSDMGQGQRSYPVGRKQANAFGLYDMAGNASEWCWDWYSQYDDHAVIDPSGPVDALWAYLAPPPSGLDRTVPAQLLARMIRGGSWQAMATYCRSAARSNANPNLRSDRIGFRVVRTATP